MTTPTEKQTEDKYLFILTQSCSRKEVDEWLKHNPPPKEFKGGPYAWASTEMPVGSYFTWYRRRVLGWKI
jgi:hypothetical protein